MSHTPHDLAAEFPQDTAILHQLKLENAHFRTLSDRYHTANREIHRIESEVEAASDNRSEAMKKLRLGLLDEIAALISKEKPAAG